MDYKQIAANFSDWHGERGWANENLNTEILLTKNGITGANVRSLYYNLPGSISSGRVKIRLEIKGNYRIVLSNSSDPRNPMERDINNILSSSIISHINFDANNKKRIYLCGVDKTTVIKPMDKGVSLGGVSLVTYLNNTFVYEFDIDYDTNDITLDVTVSSDEGDIKVVDGEKFGFLETAVNSALAQIRVIFKDTTVISGFELSATGEKSGQALEIDDFVKLKYDITEFGGIDVISGKLTLDDLKNSIGVSNKRGLLFPKYLYKGRNYSSFDELKADYTADSSELVFVYPEPDENMLAVANYTEKLETTPSRDNVIKWLETGIPNEQNTVEILHDNITSLELAIVDLYERGV